MIPLGMQGEVKTHLFFLWVTIIRMAARAADAPITKMERSAETARIVLVCHACPAAVGGHVTPCVMASMFLASP